MSQKTYYEKLKDPRWQKKRLEVMEKAEFRCSLCMDDTSTLNVHHKEYFKGKEPWDYEAEQLVCLCEDCHANIHEEIDILKWVCSYALLDGPNSREELAVLLAGYMGIDKEKIFSLMPMGGDPYFEKIYQIGEAAQVEKWQSTFRRMEAARKALSLENETEAF